jgi:hypothetical protein
MTTLASSPPIHPDDEPTIALALLEQDALGLHLQALRDDADDDARERARTITVRRH